MLSQDYLNKIYSYDPETGLLTNNKTNKTVGHHDKFGYLRTYVSQKKVSVARIIWKMVHGKFNEKMFVRHLNGVKDDNRLSNLCLAETSR